MKQLSRRQRELLLDLMEAVLDDGPISDEMVRDPHIVFRFLYISKDVPDVVHRFIHLMSIDQLCYLTRLDVVSEELMLDLHLRYGFQTPQLAQWLRGIGYGGFSFFIHQAMATEKMELDSLILQARTSYHMVEGILIDSIQTQFPTLNRLLDYVLNQRISFHQYRDILAQMDVAPEEIEKELEFLIENYNVFSPIQSSKQILPFRVFCSFFDLISDKPEYLTAISQVFDQLLSSSSIKKTVSLLNDFPYPIIQFMLNRYLKFNITNVCDHLNQTIRDFHYGSIRKIVRRDEIGLNYRYE